MSLLLCARQVGELGALANKNSRLVLAVSVSHASQVSRSSQLENRAPTSLRIVRATRRKLRNELNSGQSKWNFLLAASPPGAESFATKCKARTWSTIYHYWLFSRLCCVMMLSVVPVPSLPALFSRKVVTQDATCAKVETYLSAPEMQICAHLSSNLTSAELIPLFAKHLMATRRLSIGAQRS